MFTVIYFDSHCLLLHTFCITNLDESCRHAAPKYTLSQLLILLIRTMLFMSTLYDDPFSTALRRPCFPVHSNFEPNVQVPIG